MLERLNGGSPTSDVPAMPTAQTPLRDSCLSAQQATRADASDLSSTLSSALARLTKQVADAPFASGFDASD
ncbi:hypothetical protein CBOM_05652 [Ceraceosorus bombacis]|uniref:Uncharacterized protein n=1 Tax=Ceraceosorus bombacis TaxID=401625 RepID=A0A0N7LBB9_9BASI|nr:hypothetical protein CBOM_05652 [Ceraceosorus bombacis]